MAYLVELLKQRLEIEENDTSKDYLLSEAVAFSKGVLLNYCSIHSFNQITKEKEFAPVNNKFYFQLFPVLSLDKIEVGGVDLVKDNKMEWLEQRVVTNYPTGGFTDVTLKDTITSEVFKFKCKGENSDGNNEWEVLGNKRGNMSKAVSNNEYDTDFFTLTIKDDSDNKFQEGDLLFFMARKEGNYFSDFYTNPRLNSLYTYKVTYTYGYAFDEMLPSDLKALLLNLANYYFTKANSQTDGITSLGNQIGDDLKQVPTSFPVSIQTALDLHKKMVL